MFKLVRISLLALLLLVVAACRTAGSTAAPTAAVPDGDGGAPLIVTNLTTTCVDNYAAGVDYFPQESTVQYATGFTVEYFDNYKVVRVNNAYPGATETFTYVLVQCGTPTPTGFDDALVIETPIDSIVSMSTTYVAQLDRLGLLQSVVGLDSGDFVSNATLRPRIDSGDVQAIGFGPTVNVELLLTLDPDLVMTYAIGFPDSDTHPTLLAAGIPTVLNSDWVETTPLGRAEWLKFTALFYNQEATANQVFDDIAIRYNEAVALAATAETQPVVFANTPFQGTWYMPGGGSYLARLLADANATYPWADTPDTGSLFLAIESVFADAQDADVWINIEYAASLSDLEATDSRFAEFRAFQEGNVWSNARRQTPYGNDFYETGAVDPHEILLDLIAILHPELLPDRPLKYYQLLQ